MPPLRTAFLVTSSLMFFGCDAGGSTPSSKASSDTPASMPTPSAQIKAKLASSASPADTTQASANSGVPLDVRSLATAGAKLLAYQTGDLMGDGHQDAVIIVRNNSAKDVAAANPCELIILQRQSDRLKVLGRSSTAVDCVYNDLARKADDLNKNLKLAPQQVTYINQQAKGYSSYTFHYLKDRGGWYFAKAVRTHPKYNEKTDSMDVLRESVSSPQDVALTRMSDFDPDKLETLLEKSSKPIP